MEQNTAPAEAQAPAPTGSPLGLKYRSIRPVRDQVLLGQHPNPEKSDGGIFLPQSAQGGQQMAYYVVAIGPEVKELRVGDKVVTPLYFEHLTVEDRSEERRVGKECRSRWSLDPAQ